MKTHLIQKEWREFSLEVDLLEGTSAVYEKGVLSVTGPKGTVSKRLKYPSVEISVESGKIVLLTKKFSKRAKKMMTTYRAHMNNLMKGVSEGFEYKLAVVYAKFPMTVEMKGKTFFVKNLLGMKVPREVQIPEGVEVKIEGGKDIFVTGIDKELVGQVAASLEQSTRVTHLDRRVIQDGIFITEKPHRRYS
jgi:large subunit ribosomal protein L6